MFLTTGKLVTVQSAQPAGTSLHNSHFKIIRVAANNTTNELIGTNITGNGTNTVTIGNSSTTTNYFSGEIATNLLHLGYQDYGPDLVGISATPHATLTKYMLMQRLASGEVYLNSPPDVNLNIRNGNSDRIVIRAGIASTVTAVRV